MFIFFQLQLTPHGLSSLLLSWTRYYHLQLCATEVGYCAVISKWCSILSALLQRIVQSRGQWKDSCLFPWRTTVQSIFLYTQGSFLAQKGRKQSSCIFLIPQYLCSQKFFPINIHYTSEVNKKFRVLIIYPVQNISGLWKEIDLSAEETVVMARAELLFSIKRASCYS